jgi:hypothetical protein
MSDEQVNAAAASGTDATDATKSAAESAQTDNPNSEAVASGDAGAEGKTASGTAENATLASTAPPTPAAEHGIVADPVAGSGAAAAAAPAPEVGDPGDENPTPLKVADNMAKVTISVDGQQATHSFYPNSTPLRDSLREVLRRTLNIDLDSLEKTGPLTVSIDGTEVSLDASSLDLGVHDGSDISLKF